MYQEFSKNSEIKAFALKKVPEGLTLMEVASLSERPGWVFPKPSWNFGGKWLIGGGRVMETQSPEEDIVKLLSGMDSASIEAEHVINAVDANGDGRVDEAEFMKMWPGDRDSAIQKFQELDADVSGDLSFEEVKKAIEDHQVSLSTVKPVSEPPSEPKSC